MCLFKNSCAQCLNAALQRRSLLFNGLRSVFAARGTNLSVRFSPTNMSIRSFDGGGSHPMNSSPFVPTSRFDVRPTPTPRRRPTFPPTSRRRGTPLTAIPASPPQIRSRSRSRARSQPVEDDSTTTSSSSSSSGDTDSEDEATRRRALRWLEGATPAPVLVEEPVYRSPPVLRNQPQPSMHVNGFEKLLARTFFEHPHRATSSAASSSSYRAPVRTPQVLVLR